MSWYIIALLIICSVTILIDCSLIILWSFNKSKPTPKLQDFPKVSILVAARNEALNIDNCIKSLIALDYPADKIEILIGDDQSEDHTLEIAKMYQLKHSHIQVFTINQHLGLAKGKANVLANLAKKATGKYYFITDADVTVPSTWLHSMLQAVSSNQVAIVNGFTIVKDSIWQKIDWLFSLGMVKVISDIGKPVTAMGNNMLISKEAYQSIGGYESIPFSVTEDFEIFKHVTKKGYKVVQLANDAVKAETLAQPNFIELLHQRKRWMMGAVQLPWPIVAILSIQAIYFPAVIALLFFSLENALLVIGTKMLFQSTFILLISNHLKVRISFYQTLLFEFYSVVVAVSTGLFYLLPIKIIWKGRKY